MESGICESDTISKSDAYQLWNEGDSIHFTATGSSMQGCLAARLGLSTLADQSLTKHSGQPVERIPLPKPLWPEYMDSADAVYMFSAPFGDRVPEDQLNGWKLEAGGKEGKKTWYSAGAPGQAIAFEIPPSTRVEVEFYRHPDLPMGLVEVLIDGHVSAYLDACCPEGGCVGVPAHQGFYYTEQVGNELSFIPHIVQLRVVDRNSTTCAQSGHQFNLRSIAGLVKRGTNGTF